QGARHSVDPGGDGFHLEPGRGRKAARPAISGPARGRADERHHALLREEPAPGAQSHPLITQAVPWAARRRARQAPKSTINPGTRIIAQMILSRFSFTQPMFPNR